MVRSFERRLERLLDGVAGRVFSGRLHPAEIAGRLAREADFARFEHETGPATANAYTILVNPRDLNADPAELAAILTMEVERHTSEEGLRLEGPCVVTIRPTEKVPQGSLGCQAEVVPGPPVPWARLISGGNSFEIGRNRASVGRSSSADVTLPYDDVSRRHALVWRQGGRSWAMDLGSANGTVVDGRAVTDDPIEISAGSAVTFASNRFRFTVI